MNCSKCNQPMKKYIGLFEEGWDCTNIDCGKIISIKIQTPDPDYSKLSDDELAKIVSEKLQEAFYKHFRAQNAIYDVLANISLNKKDSKIPSDMLDAIQYMVPK